MTYIGLPLLLVYPLHTLLCGKLVIYLLAYLPFCTGNCIMTDDTKMCMVCQYFAAMIIIGVIANPYAQVSTSNTQVSNFCASVGNFCIPVRYSCEQVRYSSSAVSNSSAPTGNLSKQVRNGCSL